MSLAVIIVSMLLAAVSAFFLVLAVGERSKTLALLAAIFVLIALVFLNSYQFPLPIKGT